MAIRQNCRRVKVPSMPDNARATRNMAKSGGSARAIDHTHPTGCKARAPREELNGISGLVVEYIVAIDVTRVRFPADAIR